MLRVLAGDQGAVDLAGGETARGGSPRRHPVLGADRLEFARAPHSCGVFLEHGTEPRSRVDAGNPPVVGRSVGRAVVSSDLFE